MPGNRRILTDADLIELQRKEIEDLNQKVFEFGDKIQTLEVERDTKHLPRIAALEADLLDAAKDVERLDKLEALKKSGERWMIHDWTFHENITAYIGVWLGSNYPHKSHETLRAAVDSIRGDNE